MRRTQLSIPLLLFVAACSQPQPQPHHSGVFDTGEPALHAVTDTRLRELMNKMNSLMFERFVTEPDRARQALRDTREIAEAAAALGKSIDAISARLPALALNDSEQATFRALADKLHNQAGQLRKQALNEQVEDLHDTLTQIGSTCTACHGLFRQLDKGRGRP